MKIAEDGAQRLDPEVMARIEKEVKEEEKEAKDKEAGTKL